MNIFQTTRQTGFTILRHFVNTFAVLTGNCNKGGLSLRPYTTRRFVFNTHPVPTVVGVVIRRTQGLTRLCYSYVRLFWLVFYNRTFGTFCGIGGCSRFIRCCFPLFTHLVLVFHLVVCNGVTFVLSSRLAVLLRSK